VAQRGRDATGIFPNEASLCRLIGAVLMEQNEEWLLQHRYPPQHTMADGDAGPAELASISA
jgi:putative transposase